MSKKESNYQSVTFKGFFTPLNDMINANRTHWAKGAKIKKEQTEMASMQLGKMKKIESPCIITWHWFVSSNHDPDNVFSAKKFLLDAMVKKKKLENDNQKWILGFGGDHLIKVPKGQEKVVVDIEEFPDGKD